MAYQIIAAIFFIIAVLLVLLSGRILLLDRKWFLGFLRGMSGILLLCLAVLITLVARDLMTYDSAYSEKSVLTLSFAKKEGNHYRVELQEASGVTYSADIVGQQWQLNARMFKWTPIMTAMGFRTGYRLQDIQGRFMELQMDRVAGREPPVVLNLGKEVDVWNFLSETPWLFSFVEAYTSTPGFIPMADGAIFDVTLKGTHLAVQPLNDSAKAALASW